MTRIILDKIDSPGIESAANRAGQSGAKPGLILLVGPGGSSSVGLEDWQRNMGSQGLMGEMRCLDKIFSEMLNNSEGVEEPGLPRKAGFQSRFSTDFGRLCALFDPKTDHFDGFLRSSRVIFAHFAMSSQHKLLVGLQNAGAPTRPGRASGPVDSGRDGRDCVFELLIFG